MPPTRSQFPTKKNDWVHVGDTCVSVSGMKGVVLRIIEGEAVPRVKVAWENGYTGSRILITNVRVWRRDIEGTR